MKQLTKDCIADISVEVVSPSAPGLFEFNKGSGFLAPVQQKQFHSLVVKLMHVHENVRPACSDSLDLILSTRVLKPKFDDDAVLQRVYGFLKKK